MKVIKRKGTGFYIRAAKSFFKEKVIADCQPAVEAKAVELKVIGLGEAISVAIAVAMKLEAENIADISNIETGYPEMNGARNCSSITVTMKKSTKAETKPKTNFTVTVLNLNGEPMLDRAEIGPTEQVRKLMYSPSVCLSVRLFVRPRDPET